MVSFQLENLIQILNKIKLHPDNKCQKNNLKSISYSPAGGLFVGMELLQLYISGSWAQNAPTRKKN